jgi:hypothetical protein
VLGLQLLVYEAFELEVRAHRLTELEVTRGDRLTEVRLVTCVTSAADVCEECRLSHLLAVGRTSIKSCGWGAGKERWSGGWRVEGERVGSGGTRWGSVGEASRDIWHPSKW